MISFFASMFLIGLVFHIKHKQSIKIARLQGRWAAIYNKHIVTDNPYLEHMQEKLYFAWIEGYEEIKNDII